MPKKKVKAGELKIFTEIPLINKNIEVMASFHASQPTLFTQFTSNTVFSVIALENEFYPTEHCALIAHLQCVAPQQKLSISIKQKCSTMDELNEHLSTGLFLNSLLLNEKNMAVKHQAALSQSLNFQPKLSTRAYADIYHCDNSIFCHPKKKRKAGDALTASALDETITPEVMTEDIEF